ncbi:MAG: GtrA family protein [Pseudomonadota bacterium]
MIRYVGTGGVAAIVDLSGFAALTAYGAPLLAAAAASFVAAVIVNYALCSLFVFDAQMGPARFAAFFGAALIGLSVNVGVTYAAHAGFAVAPLFAKTVGIGVAAAGNYLLNAFVVFREQPVERPDA